MEYVTERPVLPKNRYVSSSELSFLFKQQDSYIDYLINKNRLIDDENNFHKDRFLQIKYLDRWTVKTAKIRYRYIECMENDYHVDESYVIRRCISHRVGKKVFDNSWTWGRKIKSDDIKIRICDNHSAYVEYDKVDLLHRFYDKVYLDCLGVINSYDLMQMFEYDHDNIDERLFLESPRGYIYDFLKGLQSQLTKWEIKSLRSTHVDAMITQLLNNKIKWNKKKVK
jgi:hypothetical protein